MNRSDTPSASDTFLRLAQQSNTRSKRNLTVTALKFALLDGEHERTYVLLKQLKRPLSPKDAEAVCQAAMNSPKNLMNAVLDRCPPAPQFLPRPTHSFWTLFCSGIPISCRIRCSASERSPPPCTCPRRTPLF